MTLVNHPVNPRRRCASSCFTRSLVNGSRFPRLYSVRMRVLVIVVMVVRFVAVRVSGRA
jgi:hypothetical protein